MHHFLRSTYSYLAIFLSLGLLASCTMGPTEKQEFLMPPESIDQKGGKAEKAEEWYQSSGDGVYKLGKPYKVNGVWYFPAENWKYDEIGYASVYSPDFDNHSTSNGEVYRKDALTASHKTLPLPSIVRVTNLANNTSIIVRINDRGPFSNDRLLDLSERAAKMLEFEGPGPARVRIEILPEESKKATELLMYGKKSEDRLLTIPNTSKAKDTDTPPIVVTTLPSDTTAPESAVENKATTSSEEGRKGEVEDTTVEPPVVNAPNNEEGPTEVSSEHVLELTQVLGNQLPDNASANIPLEGSNGVTPESAPENVGEPSSLSPAQLIETTAETSQIPSSAPIATTSVLNKGPYYIQAGTFGIEGNAVKLSNKLSSFAKTSIIPTTNGARQLKKVEVGPFVNKQDAEKVMIYIKQAIGLKDAKLLKR